MSDEEMLKAALKRFQNAWREPRSPQRIAPMLVCIESIWAQFPDLRLGQILISAIGEDRLFYLEDNDLIKELKEWVEQVTE